MEPIKIIKYSERSFVLTGKETKTYKDILKELGGGYNRSLTDPNTGDKFSGWVFPAKKKQLVISELIMKDIEYVSEEE
jgi:hypothetical protein